MSEPKAYATYEVVTPTHAVVEVTVPGGGWSMQRVETRAGRDQYEACYRAAEVICALHGWRLERFAKQSTTRAA